MKNTPKPDNILISWIGLTDIRASKGENVGIGPVAQALTKVNFDLAVLLSNTPKKQTGEYIKWLEGQTQTPIHPQLTELSSPTNFGEIYEAVIELLNTLKKKYGDIIKLTFHLSPGTPAMAAVWIIVSKTRHAAVLLESSREHGVQTATVPFDISAEFIPELYKRPDADLTRLTSGLADEAPGFESIIHRSSEMKQVIAMAQRIAPRSVPVLIEGESGTGKELMARALHIASPRRDNPFIAINCGAIASELMESEFFGHKKGAFTGAESNHAGHFEAADNGTLFLDEIGELPLKMQVKLLRVLETKTVVRLGTSKEIPVNVRIVAATNRTLADEVSNGNFREDLFYRIVVGMLKLPPLRTRRGDLGLLIDHLIETINMESASEPDWKHKKISTGARNLLLKHDWPGNIRELKNTLTRATVWSTGETIKTDHIRMALLSMPGKNKSGDDILNRDIEDGIDLQSLIGDVSRHYITRAMKETGNNKSKTASLLGFNSYQTLNGWLKKYSIK